MKNLWLRLYTEILNDPKVQLLDAELFKIWVNLLCIAKGEDDDGRLPSAGDIAFHLRCSVGNIDKSLAALVDAGLIDFDGEQYAMHGWTHRQYESDNDPTSLQRKRRQRLRDRDDESDGTDNVTDMSRVTSQTSHAQRHANVTRTETEAETDTETETERENMAPDEPSPSLAPPEAEKPSPGKSKRFTPPSLEDVTAYCQERRNAVDPGRWLAYYEANGWKVGRNPMRDWRAAVRTWEGNGYDRPPGKPAVPVKQETEEQRALREKARRLFGPKALRETVGGVP